MLKRIFCLNIVNIIAITAVIIIGSILNFFCISLSFLAFLISKSLIIFKERNGVITGRNMTNKKRGINIINIQPNRIASNMKVYRNNSEYNISVKTHVCGNKYVAEKLSHDEQNTGLGAVAFTFCHHVKTGCLQLGHAYIFLENHFNH